MSGQTEDYPRKTLCRNPSCDGEWAFVNRGFHNHGSSCGPKCRCHEVFKLNGKI